MRNRRPKLRIVAPAASPEEAAAVVAALEQFRRDTAPVRATQEPEEPGRWARAALLEATGHGPQGHAPWSAAAGW